jgi:ATP-binding cassette subfamily C (CFTR/MRP) protein 1
MDDLIAALDAKVKKKIWEEVFEGLLKGKTRVLVTHSADFIHLVNRVIIINEGRI